MATTTELKGTLSTSLYWQQKETNNTFTTNTIIDEQTNNYTKNWTSGVGSGLVNTIWHTTKTLSASETEQYNLQSLTRDVFGSSFTESFSKLKAVVVENLSVASGASISFMATGTNAFTDPFPHGSGKVSIPAQSPFILANYAFGWNIGASNNLIQIEDTAGSGAQYRIAAIGEA